MTNLTITATTTRAVTFSVVHPTIKQVTATETFPAGTEVYARPTKNGRFKVRIPGTRFTQRVNADTLNPDA